MAKLLLRETNVNVHLRFSRETPKIEDRIKRFFLVHSLISEEIGKNVNRTYLIKASTFFDFTLKIPRLRNMF